MADLRQRKRAMRLARHLAGLPQNVRHFLLRSLKRESGAVHHLVRDCLKELRRGG